MTAPYGTVDDTDRVKLSVSVTKASEARTEIEFQQARKENAFEEE